MTISEQPYQFKRLSVLAAVIGLLILVIVAVSTTEVSAPSKSEVTSAQFIIDKNISYSEQFARTRQYDRYIGQRFNFSGQPIDPVNNPIVVYLHAGGWVSGDKQATGLESNFRYLQQQGYNVYAVNYRLAQDAPWPAQINDTKCFLRYLASSGKGIGNRQSILLWGDSAGGQLALLAGASSKDELVGNCEWSDGGYAIKGIIANSAPTYLADLATSSMKSQIRQLLNGDPYQLSDLALQASPLNYVSADDPPILLLTGGKDTQVPSTQAQKLHEAYAKIGLTIQWTNYPELNHLVEINRLDGPAFARLTQFFDQAIR